MAEYIEWGYRNAKEGHTAAYLVPRLFELAGTLTPGTRVLDVGCGNGAISAYFLKRDCKVIGIDLSKDGIEWARKAHPQGRYEVLAADQHLLENLNEAPFDIVMSTEVVEHLTAPRDYARGCLLATRPGGRFICTTPYHGYLKNLAISLTNKWDDHITPFWDGGHIKFWSRKTLGRLLTEAGFTNLQFRGAGRLPYLWMSMVMSGDRPV